MWNAPSTEQLEKLPRLYATEDVELSEKTVHLHFMYGVGSYDWWIFEYDPTDKLFFGWVNLNDPDNAECGYISLQELLDLRAGAFEVDHDLYWKPRAFGTIAGTGFKK